MNILAVDDHFLFRSGLRFTIERLNDQVKFFEAACLNEAKDVIQEHPIKIVLLDLNLPDIEWKNTIPQIQNMLSKNAHLVVISGDECPKIMKTIQQMGVLGYIPKSLAPNKFVLALSIVLEGESYFPRECLEFQSNGDNLNEFLNQLTPKQKKTLSLLVQGYTNKQIASEMCISQATVKSYLSLIYKTLDVNNRTEAVYKCQQMGVDFQN